MKYDAILLTSFGGPEAPEEVMPFLERVTEGRGVPRERLESVAEHYLHFGGVSPINDQNRELLTKMRELCLARGIDQPIYWGNRNSEPYFADTLRKIYQDGHENILTFVTSAYSSYSGCRQYRENLAKALIETELEGKLSIDKIRHYFDHPGFVEPFAQGLIKSLNQANEAGVINSELRIYFTTHSIPMSMAGTSGPESIRGKNVGGAYVAQHLAVAQEVIKKVVDEIGPLLPEWELVYQSRSGAPTIPWLEPDINDAIEESASHGIKGVILVPIGFISDHLEVVWDLDNEAKATAQSHSMFFSRVSTPGINEKFVKAIVDLIDERVNGTPALALSELGPWASPCQINCCPNARTSLPAVAESK